MRASSTAIACVLLAGCVAEHGDRPRGGDDVLDGTWVEEELRIWRIHFDEDAGTFAASFGGADGGTSSGTFTRDTPTTIEISCGGCALEQRGSLRVGDRHMLFMGVMDGSEIVGPGSSWSDTHVSRDVDCEMRSFTRTWVLRIPEIVEQSLTMCPGTADTRWFEHVIGTWTRNDDGFELAMSLDDVQQIFVLKGGLSMTRWTRDLSP